MNTLKLSMTGFDREPRELQQAQIEAFQRVLSSYHYILGPEVRAFEEEWSAYCQVKHAVGVGNGMDAIEIAVRCLGLGAGDEVIVPAMSAFASALGVARSGAIPVLADIEPQSALLSLASAERCLSSKSRAVLLVHLYGRMPDMPAWVSFCRKHNLLLIEDCAQAHGAEFAGKRAGAWGEIGAYSFYPTKNLGALGDAGCLITEDAELARRARALRDYGQSSRYVHDEVGLNSRLDELQAALLRARLSFLDLFTKRRIEIGSFYERALLESGLGMPISDGRQRCVYHQFVCTHPQRNALCEALKIRGVPTLVHYPSGLHEQKAALSMRRDPSGLPQTELHARACFSLPCHPQLTNSELAFVVESLKACVARL